MQNQGGRQGCKGRSLILVGLIVALALAILSFAIISLIDRRSGASIEPMGPSTSQSPPGGGAPDGGTGSHGS
ncbi:hypothetical protein BH10PSE12_BH10PSE12_26940 [soil metagenome]